MPTGYTGELYERGQTFKDFTLRCARAFGALISMRDEGWDAQIPDKVEVPAFYAEQVKDAEEELVKAKAMTLEDAKKFLPARKKADSKDNKKAYEKEMVRYKRFIAMREEVRAWTPPTPDHEGLKDFMLEQLEHDCREPKLRENEDTRTPEEYRVEWIEWAEETLVRRREDLKKAQDGAKEKEHWIKMLKASLVNQT